MHAPSSPIRAASDASVWCACDITSQEQRATHCDEAEWVSVSRSVFTHAHGKQAHQQTQGHGTQTRHDVSTWFAVVCVQHNTFFLWRCTWVNALSRVLFTDALKDFEGMMFSMRVKSNITQGDCSTGPNGRVAMFCFAWRQEVCFWSHSLCNVYMICLCRR